jgi:predicted O-methyltransferase YrrM
MNIIDKDIYKNLELLPEDLQGWNGNDKIFNDLIDHLKPERIIEVGSWKGQSSINMGKIVNQLNLNTKIHCVDTWLGAVEFWTTYNNEERDLILKNGYPQIYYQFLSNVVHNDLQNIISPFPNTSENGYRYYKHNKITAKLIYIDASHEEEDVYKDITNYYELLEPGGVMFGDDYISWVGVKKAVDRFTKENNIELDIRNEWYWVINKK